MNRIYHSIWNAVVGTWIAAAETTKSRTRGRSAPGRRLGTRLIAASIVAIVVPCVSYADVTLGPHSEAPYSSSVAVGVSAKAHRENGVAVGAGSESMGDGATAVGAGAKAHGDNSTASGTGASATQKNSLAVGAYARAEREGSIALGYLAAATGNNSLAIGANARAQRDNSLALGDNADVTASNSVALGPSSVATGNTLNQQAYLIGGTAKGEVSVGSTGNERRITNVAAGAQDTDAVNVAQLNKAVTSAGTSPDAVLYDNSAHARVTLGGVGHDPVTIANVANGVVASGSTDAVNGGQLFAIEARTNSNAIDISKLQYNFKYFRANDNGGVDILGDRVEDSSATGAGSVAVGPNASAKGIASTALGWKANAQGTGGVAVGTGATGDRANGAAGGWSTAIGSNAYAKGDRSVALGADTEALGENSVALGKNARVTSTSRDSAAIGAGSVADGKNLASQAWLTGGTAQSEVSVGSANNERRITNLAAGAADTDAVNVAQIKALDSAIRSGAVMYDDATQAQVTLKGAGGTRIRNVANGTQADDAVNFSQLEGVRQDALSWNATSKAYDASHATGGATNRITNVAAGQDVTDAVNVGQLNALGSGIRDGAVMYDTGDGGQPDYGRVTLRGQGGTTINNVAAGEISATSMYAINGSQLHGMANSIGQSLGGGAGVDQSGNWRGPTYNVGNNTYTNVGDALTNIDGRVTSVEGSVTTLNQQINNGEIGLVRQDPSTGTITVAADRNGTVVDVAGTDGTRKITGVADGDIAAGSSDAVNGGQIYSLEQQLGVVNNQMSVHAQTLNQSIDQSAAYTDQQVGAALRSANAYTDSRISSVRRDGSAGTAAAMAIAGLPQSIQYGRNLVSLSGATYDGQSAVALGISRVSASGRWVFKGGATSNTRGYYGFSVGAGMHW